MSPEETAVIRTIIREEISSVREEITSVERRINARQDRAVEAIASEFSAMRGEMKSVQENTDRRAERVAETLRSIDARMSAMTKWADTFDRDNAALNSSFHEQQRAIQRLTARVEAIERQQQPPQQ